MRCSLSIVLHLICIHKREYIYFFLHRLIALHVADTLLTVLFFCFVLLSLAFVSHFVFLLNAVSLKLCVFFFYCKLCVSSSFVWFSFNVSFVYFRRLFVGCWCCCCCCFSVSRVIHKCVFRYFFSRKMRRKYTLRATVT